MTGKVADQSWGFSFTIKHIVAVSIPAAFGYLYLQDDGLVVQLGAGMAVISLALVARDPPRPARKPS